MEQGYYFATKPFDRLNYTVPITVDREGLSPLTIMDRWGVIKVF